MFEDFTTYNYSGFNQLNAGQIDVFGVTIATTLWTAWPQTPFLVYLQNIYGGERLKVVKIFYMCCAFTNWRTVDRRKCVGNPLAVQPSTEQVTTDCGSSTQSNIKFNFVRFMQLERSPQIANKSRLLSSSTMPAGWKCLASYYNERARGVGDENAVCHCNCGMFDPDCKPREAPDVVYEVAALGNKNARSNYEGWKASGSTQINVDGCNSTHPSCNIKGLCTSTPQNLDIEISLGCEVIGLPGETILNGFIGSQEDYMKEYTDFEESVSGQIVNDFSQCMPCNGDKYYSGLPQLASHDGQYVCNFRPDLIMDSRYSQNQLFDKNGIGEVILGLVQPSGLPIGQHTAPIPVRFLAEGSHPEGSALHGQDYAATAYAVQRFDEQHQLVNLTRDRGNGLQLPPNGNGHQLPQAVLVSVIGPDTDKMYVAMELVGTTETRKTNWFWPNGMFIVHLLNTTFEISSASAVPSNDVSGIQELRIYKKRPSTSFGWEAPLSQDATGAGIQYVVVTPPSTVNTTLLNYPLLAMLSDDTNSGVKAFAVRIVSFSQPAGDTRAPTGGWGTSYLVTLERPVQPATLGGSSKSWIMSQNAKISLGTLAASHDAIVYTQMKVRIKEAEAAKPYPATERSEGHGNEPFASPSKLDIGLYMVATPDGMADPSKHDKPIDDTPTGWLNTTLSLCPNITLTGPPYAGKAYAEPIFTRHAWGDWTVLPDHLATVSACQTEDVFQECIEVSSTFYHPLTSKCVKSMPPIMRQTYKLEAPINSKWKPSADTPSGIRNLPEFSAQRTEIFEFLFGHDSVETEAAWNRGKHMAQYDTGQNLLPKAGERRFRGEGRPYGLYASTAKLLPADAPLAAGTARIGIHSRALDDLTSTTGSTGAKVGCKAPKSWPENADDLSLLLEKFQPMDIKWNLMTVLGTSSISAKDANAHFLDDGIRLEPGFGYLFSATVRIKPLYVTDRAGAKLLSDWSNSVSELSVVKYMLPEGDNNKVKFHHSIYFDNQINPSETKYQMDIWDLIFTLVSICCYAVMGAVILVTYNRIEAYILMLFKAIEAQLNKRKKKIELNREYLTELADFAKKEVKITEIAGHINFASRQMRELNWSAFKTRQELGILLDPTGFMCLQVLNEAKQYCIKKASTEENYKEVLESYKMWWECNHSRSGLAMENNGMDDVNKLWQQFWIKYEKTTITHLLREFMEPEKVRQMMQG